MERSITCRYCYCTIGNWYPGVAGASYIGWECQGFCETAIRDLCPGFNSPIVVRRSNIKGVITWWCRGCKSGKGTTFYCYCTWSNFNPVPHCTEPILIFKKITDRNYFVTSWILDIEITDPFANRSVWLNRSIVFPFYVLYCVFIWVYWKW